MGEWAPPPEVQLLPSFLHACVRLDAASTALLIVAALPLAGASGAAHGNWQHAAIALSLGAGLVEKYFALRVRFDLELFRALAAGRLDLERLDRGLAALFGRPLPGETRDWNSRVTGAMRLARRQLLALAVQGLVLVLLAAALAV